MTGTNGSGPGRALQIFEEVLDLIGSQDKPLGRELVSLIPPLPSMVEQCEEMVLGHATMPSNVHIVHAFPGTAQSKPEWWEARVPGLSCISISSLMTFGVSGLSPAGAERIVAQYLAAAVQETEQLGRQLMIVAAPGEKVPNTLKPRSEVVVVSHPILAFEASNQSRFWTKDDSDSFFDELNEFLNDDVHYSFLRTEDLENVFGLEKALKEHFSMESSLPVLRLFPDQEDVKLQAEVDSTQFQTSAAFLKLCRRLGYEPEYSGTSSATSGYSETGGKGDFRKVRNLSQKSGNKALIAGFLDQVTHTCRHLEPTNPEINKTILEIERLLDASLQDGDNFFLERLDAFSDYLSQPDKALCLLAAAHHSHLCGNRLQALSLAAEALSMCPPETRYVQVLAASFLLELGALEEALLAVMQDAIHSSVLAKDTQELLKKAVSKLSVDQAPMEHGHSLLIDHLVENYVPPDDHTPVLIEIGTTRETVAGQGSTEKLALLCQELGIEFVTVDMDPRNTRNARRMFQRHGMSFSAVTAKGEDYLAEYSGQIDYVFLDAYDFDHGKHSEIRQGRYKKFLGGRIDEEQCHKMHLACAKTLITNLSSNGLICFDDTWTTADGNWTAKGTTAMPFLLEHGFVLIEARNRAALLRHSD